MSGNLCCFFCVGLSAFSSPKLRFRSRWTQTVKVEARPHHSRDSPQLVIISPTNKQTNKQTKRKPFGFCEEEKRLWAEKERIKWKSSVATGSIDPWPNFEQIHFVTLSVNRQHFHVARKASLLPSFMPLLVQSHNPSCDNTKWENLLHSTIKLLIFCLSKIELCWGREKLWAIVRSIRKYSRATNKITSSHSAW